MQNYHEEKAALEARIAYLLEELERQRAINAHLEAALEAQQEQERKMQQEQERKMQAYLNSEEWEQKVWRLERKYNQP